MCTMEVHSQVEIRRWEGNLTCADLINVNHWLPLNSTAMACLLCTLLYKKSKWCLLPSHDCSTLLYHDWLCLFHAYVQLFQSGLYKLWNPAISDGRPWSKFGKHQEHGNWRTWKRWKTSTKWLRHFIYDSKHSFYDSKHSIVQPYDSKYYILQHLWRRLTKSC